MVRDWVWEFSLAGSDMGHSEGGLSLLGWLLDGLRLGLEILFCWADLAHSAPCL